MSNNPYLKSGYKSYLQTSTTYGSTQPSQSVFVKKSNPEKLAFDSFLKSKKLQTLNRSQTNAQQIQSNSFSTRGRVSRVVTQVPLTHSRTQNKMAYSQRQPVSKTHTSVAYRSTIPKNVRNVAQPIPTSHKIMGKSKKSKMFDSEIWEQWNFDRKLDQAPSLRGDQFIPPLPDILDYNQKRKITNDIIMENRIKEQSSAGTNQYNKNAKKGTYSAQVPANVMRGFGQYLKEFNPTFNQYDYYARGKADYRKMMMERVQNNQRRNSLNQPQNPPNYFNQSAPPRNGMNFSMPPHNFQAPPPPRPPHQPIPPMQGNYFQPPPPPSQFNQGPPPPIQMQFNQQQSQNNPYFQELLKNSQRSYGNGNQTVMNQLRSQQGQRPASNQKRAVNQVLYQSHNPRARANTMGNQGYQQSSQYHANNYYC